MNLGTYRWRNCTEASCVQYYKYSGVRPPTLFVLIDEINSEPSMNCSLGMLDISGMRKKSSPLLSNCHILVFGHFIPLFSYFDQMHFFCALSTIMCII